MKNSIEVGNNLQSVDNKPKKKQLEESKPMNLKQKWKCCHLASMISQIYWKKLHNKTLWDDFTPLQSMPFPSLNDFYLF